MGVWVCRHGGKGDSGSSQVMRKNMSTIVSNGFGGKGGGGGVFQSGGSTDGPYRGGLFNEFESEFVFEPGVVGLVG